MDIVKEKSWVSLAALSKHSKCLSRPTSLSSGVDRPACAVVVVHPEASWEYHRPSVHLLASLDFGVLVD